MEQPSANNPIDDLALMRRTAARDESAFAELFDRHSGLIFAICLRILRDRAEAEAVLVDIFAELWERAGRFDPARGAPLTFLTTLARSRAIDRLRARPKDVPTRLDASDPWMPPAKSENPLSAALLEERRRKVIEAMEGLNPTYKEAVELAFFDGMSHSQIAEKLNRPLGSVKSQIRQGLIQIRDRLRKYWQGSTETP